VNSGDQIVNPLTGQRLIFRRTAADTGGDLLEIESVWERPGDPPPEHRHPNQSERFEVLDGELTATVDGVAHRLAAGAVLEIGPGARHTMFNQGPAPARAIWQTRPALATEGFLETIWDIAHLGGPDAPRKSAVRLSLQALGAHRQEIRLSRPPWPIQRLLFLVLGRQRTR
jgi:quercetin dioxygenase-like cupin family protein